MENKSNIGKLLKNRPLEIIFNSIQDALFLAEFKNGEFYYIVSNRAHQEFTGFRNEDLKNRTPEEVLGSEIGRKVKENYMRCILAESPVSYEEKLFLPGGERIWNVNLTPVYEEGKIKYIVGSRCDITERKKMEEELKHRLRYEKIVSRITILALEEKEKASFLEKTLMILGTETGVSRVYIFEEDDDGQTISNTFEWNAPGIEPQKDRLQKLPKALFAWWMEKIKRGEVINYSNIDDIPDEYTSLILKEQNIKSILVFPICKEDGKMSFIGFDDCTSCRVWKDEDIELLKVVAHIVCQYLINKDYEKEIIFRTYHDILTGFYNRRFIDENLHKIAVSENVPLTIIVADINNLKVINDALGHKFGDIMLKKAAEAIKRSCRESDIISRWGGDEFLIFLPASSEADAEEIIEKIKEECEKLENLPFKLSMAFGFAIMNEAKYPIDKIIKEAEEMMYRNKLLNERSSRKVILDALLSTLMEKSVETREHAERMKKWGISIAKRLKLSSRQIDELSLLALLHDIGKIGVREEILKKPASLSDEEWDEMKKHPEIGCRIAQNTAELLSVAEYILSHHEHWDGTGYPRGLKGEEIPLLSRIIAVVDAYDAMTSDRPYRRALSREEAVAELKRNAGTQFDPELVEIFLEVIGGK
ncbi:HD domain-containing phosphohydrolase [Thermosyntropha sp.]|uniref:HD domain-containing phosphohydrolase n=1 Tax=Thermosyntropha sp. TaxID=2740820 RepID=UPI0025FCB743|nr:HD domain-containing phosphohydrolase [Thermosyntropha sp.]MBO8158160.1 diguanylate cyclase [Thermosyntropha sp.]